MAQVPGPPLAPSIPAMKIVQREHGWLSPTAMEQAACVLRLTPAYLVSRRELLRHVRARPEGRRRTSTCARTSRARCSARTRSTRTIKDVLGGDPDFNVRAFECLGACEIAPMASVNGIYVGPLDRGRRRAHPRRRQGRRATSSRTSSSPSARPPPSTGRSRSDRQHRHDPLQGHRRAGPEHARRLRKPRRLRDAQEGAQDGAGRRPGRDARHRRARPRRRRLRDGPQDVLHPQGDDGQVPRLQRRRVRAGDLQGPRADAEEPASAHRGDHHRRLLHRRLAARSSSSAASTTTSPTSSTRRSPRRARRASWARTSSAPTTRSTSSSTAAPAPTSAARRPRCWTRSRASAATRA